MSRRMVFKLTNFPVTASKVIGTALTQNGKEIGVVTHAELEKDGSLSCVAKLKTKCKPIIGGISISHKITEVA